MTAGHEPNRVTSDAIAIKNSLEDPDCFEVLFDRHYDAIWRYHSRRAGPALADELASETFVRAFAGRARYDPAHLDARPWLYGIATNLLRKHARAEARRRRAYARAAEPDETSGGLEGADGEPTQRSVDRRSRLRSRVYSQGIATSVPVGTVRSRLHRARRHLRIELELEPAPAIADATAERSRS